MNYACKDNGVRIEPTPGARATCPSCKSTVIAKCGSINVWHWAHEADADCDRWSEPETVWHRSWKACFSPSEQEVVMGPHRADICTRSGRVIELQHSTISAEEIRERESFYGHGMVWVIDASPFQDNLTLRRLHGDTRFSWRWFRKSWLAAKRPVYIHLTYRNTADKLLRVKSFDDKKNPDIAGQLCDGVWGCKYEFLRFFAAQATMNPDCVERLHRWHRQESWA